MITDPIEIELNRKHWDNVRKESLIRESSYLDIDLDICGIPVKQLTPLHFTYLDFAINPHKERHRVPAFEDTCECLWIISTQFVPRNEEAKNKWIAETIVKPLMESAEKMESETVTTNEIYEELKQLWNDKATDEIWEYMEDAFLDKDEVKSNKLIAGSIDIDYYSWLDVITDMFASEYGWKDEYILNMPFARINSKIRVIKQRHSSEKVTFENKYSSKSMDAIANYRNEKAKQDNKIVITEEILRKLE
jgi:hypothetical protein